MIPALLTLADRLTARYEGAQKSDEQQLQQSGSVRGRLRSAMLVRVGERRLIRRFKEAVIHLLAGDDEEGAAPAPADLSTLPILSVHRHRNHRLSAIQQCRGVPAVRRSVYSQIPQNPLATHWLDSWCCPSASRLLRIHESVHTVCMLH